MDRGAIRFGKQGNRFQAQLRVTFSGYLVGGALLVLLFLFIAYILKDGFEAKSLLELGSCFAICVPLPTSR